MAVPVPFAGEYPEEGAGGVCRYLLRTHPTDERSLASCLCMKESIDGSNGLLWHPYAFVWRSSEGVRGNLRAGPDRYSLRCACDTEAGIVANQNEKKCAENMKGFESAH